MDHGIGNGSQERLNLAFRTSYLIAGYLRQNLTKEEERELDAWIGASEQNEQLFGELTDEKNISRSLASLDNVDTQHALLKTKGRIEFGRPRKSIRFWQYTVAASLILLIGLATFLFFNKQKVEDPIIVSHDILPGSSVAVLSTSNGVNLALQGKLDTSLGIGVRISSNEGQLTYVDGISGSASEIHTLTVPRKGSYKLVLPDGTLVWLNAESSITYPLSFGTDERKVEVTGETFFEVAKDVNRPFRVVATGVTTEATGTQFNVNAYPNEDGIRTTLVEGGVKVYKGNEKVLLLPGEQSVYNELVFIRSKVETSVITAWKDEVFKFRNTDLRAIMRQVERWYDARVVFVDKVAVNLNATVDRSVPVSKLLDYLAEAGQVQFTVKNKVIEVRNKK